MKNMPAVRAFPEQKESEALEVPQPQLLHLPAGSGEREKEVLM